MLNDFLSLFFPRLCVACDNALMKGEQLLCISCDYKMAKMDLGSGDEGFLAAKFFGRVHVKHVWAYYLFNKHARIQQVLHKMKYHNMPELGTMVGEKLGLALEAVGHASDIDIVVPVPLHRSKLRRRGYNQSEYFANGIAAQLGLEVVSDTVIRTKNTRTQTSKSRIQRWHNVREIFEVKENYRLIDKNVLLVDDVITTGSTIEACAQVILDSGVKSLSIASMAAAK